MIKPGNRLAHYEVVATLGRGGMGEVWRARDTKLERDVAIKTLPPEFAEDPERLARFEREARSLAALNHPNVASIHGLEEDDGRRFLVLELVDGETLEARLHRGPMPLEEALGIALQIAQALESAHDTGIIHRDLKPGNIKITKDGTVKVLDFGLAKPFFIGSGDRRSSTSTVATEKGVLLGTPAYMSPEQVRGEEIDTRTDVWAFGVVLHEMLTGQSLFQRRTAADTLASVLEPTRVEPSLPASTPPLIARLVRRCLERRPEDRLRHIGDARLEIRDAIDGRYSDALPEQGRVERRRSSGAIGAALAATGIALAAVVGWIWASGTDRSAPVEHYPISAAAPLFGLLREPLVAISPDGSRLTYDTAQGLFLYSIEQGTSVRLADNGPAFFSPDGESVAFSAGTYLAQVSASGGSPTSIAAQPSRPLGGTWGRSGRIVFATNEGLFSVARIGETVERLIAPDPGRGELYFAYPEMLPGDRAVVFTILPEARDAAPRIAVLDLESKDYEPLALAGSGAKYLDTGHLIFSDGGRLTAIAFDPERLSIGDDRVDLGYDITPDVPSFGVAGNGTLVYVPAREGDTVTMAWVDPSDGSEEPAGMERAYVYSRISPDGTKVIGDALVQGNRDLYIWDFVRGVETRFTIDPGEDLFAEWSEDGQTVYFSSNRGPSGVMNIYSRPANGSQPARPYFVDAEAGQWLSSSLPGGRGLLALETATFEGRESRRIVRLSLDDPPELSPVLSLNAGEMNAVVSPDGDWLAYQSHETGQTEVSVRRLDDIDGQHFKVSRSGGSHPAWSPDGRKLYYTDFAGVMYAVEIRYEPEFAPGEVTQAFPNRGYFLATTGPIVPNSGRSYDVASDGRMLMRKAGAPARTDIIHLVRNWGAALE